MRLFTLLAGYAAGLAVAMKYRKDNGTSKLTSEDQNSSKINAFIDEVVDIHKTAFNDVRWFVNENFDEVENFDDLKLKVTGIISAFTENFETHIESAKKAWITKKDELLKVAEEFYTNHESTLEQAKARAASFSWIPEEKIESWIASTKTELTAAYAKIQSKFSDVEASVESEVSKITKKAPVRKTVAKKAPVKKAE